MKSELVSWASLRFIDNVMPAMVRVSVQRVPDTVPEPYAIEKVWLLGFSVVELAGPKVS